MEWAAGCNGNLGEREINRKEQGFKYISDFDSSRLGSVADTLRIFRTYSFRLRFLYINPFEFVIRYVALIFVGLSENARGLKGDLV
ncbi:hypothetical protein VNO78_22936 [Psophocarpus tetragonolobus]|uniref:Uncharacterized protein n=1 Tax=Psophocarpus tetragonolobus TaxID=3891 RepID=A0AAN9S3M0_PSOTE